MPRLAFVTAGTHNICFQGAWVDTFAERAHYALPTLQIPCEIFNEWLLLANGNLSEDVPMWQLEQQSMTVKQALAKSYELWQSAFKTEIGLLILFCLWSGLVFVVMEIILPNYFPLSFHDLTTPHSIIAAAVVSAIYLLSFFVVYAAVFSRLKYFNNRQSLSIMSALHIGLKKLPILLAALIIASATNLIGYAGLLFQGHYYLLAIVLGILGIYLIPVFNLYYALIVIEDLGPFAAYKRSLQLIWGNWFRTALVLIMPPLLSTLAMFVAYTVFTVLQLYFKSGELGYFILFVFMQAACTTLYVSGSIVVSFVQVYNLRARKGERLPKIPKTDFQVING